MKLDLFGLVSRMLLSGHRFGIARYHLLNLGNLLLGAVGMPQGNCSRPTEYGWVLRNVKPEAKAVLDAGCAHSFLSHVLIARGLTTYGIDTSPYPARHPQLHFVQGDVTDTPFEDNFFDAIVAVSTIEHLGVGYYGDPKHPDGDLLAMRELKRILKPQGMLLVTTYYSSKFTEIESERIYDEERLDLLTQGFEIEKKEYFVYGGRGRWRKVSGREALEAPSSSPEAKIRSLVALRLVNT